MSFDWEELKQDQELLQELVDEFGIRGLARKVDKHHTTVMYHLDKFNIEPEKNKKAGEKSGEEERKPEKTDHGDYWVIRSGERSFEITKEKYRQIRRDYSGKDYLTINQICRKHKIPRWKFTLLKNAFGFTHDDTPFTDEELMNNDPEELAEIQLQRRKDQYFNKLREKEIDDALKELNKYRKRDYEIEKMHEIVAEHFSDFEDRYSGPMIPMHKEKESDLMLEVPIVDLHLAKLCWEPETGENFDRNVAEKRFMKVIYDVIQRIEDKEFEKILFPVGNDFFNFDDIEGNTTLGTRQDNDSRWQKMFAVGIELLIKGIEVLAQKAPVDVFVVPGNHDKQTSFYAMFTLFHRYHNTPTIEVDTSPKARKYREFGNCLIGFSHMDKEKSRIYGNMQVEAKKAWGRTKYHEWHGAHLHSEQVKEKHGIIVRNLSSVTAKDAWHYEKGYMSMPKSQSFIWDKETGLKNILVTNIV